MENAYGVTLQVPPAPVLFIVAPIAVVGLGAGSAAYWIVLNVAVARKAGAAMIHIPNTSSVLLMDFTFISSGRHLISLLLSVFYVCVYSISLLGNCHRKQSLLHQSLGVW